MPIQHRRQVDLVGSLASGGIGRDFDNVDAGLIADECDGAARQIEHEELAGAWAAGAAVRQVVAVFAVADGGAELTAPG
jgi:hypothetical protein